MITGAICFVGGLFFQTAFPIFGNAIKDRVSAGFSYVLSFLPKRGDTK